MATPTGFQTHERNGIERGLKRCLETMGDTAATQRLVVAKHAVDLLGDASIQQMTVEWNGRARILFSELVTVGTFARLVNNEPALTSADVKAFGEWFKKFINSFLHE
jgi:hypothetical protein